MSHEDIRWCGSAPIGTPFVRQIHEPDQRIGRCPGLRFGVERLANHNLVDRINAVDLKNFFAKSRPIVVFARERLNLAPRCREREPSTSSALLDFAAPWRRVRSCGIGGHLMIRCRRFASAKTEHGASSEWTSSVNPIRW
jgi:hypothetical protein